MKICFNARPYYDDVSARLFQALKESAAEPIEGIFVCVDEYEAAQVQSRLPGADVRRLNACVRAQWETASAERLRSYEERYGCAPIWKYIYTDRFLVKAPWDYAVRTACGLFAFYESIFAPGDIDYYYDEAIATLQSYVAFLVAKKFGTRYLSQVLARGLDGTHHYMTDDPFQSNCNFDPAYRQKAYPPEVRERAERFLSAFEDWDIRPEYMKVTGKKPRFSPVFLTLPFIWAKMRRDPKYNDPCAYLYYRQDRAVLNPALFYLRYLRYKKYYRKPDYTKKFVLFPLHFQPEASTCVCAQKYEKQLFYIDSLAKSLPADTLLYVKEHYALLGHRQPQFYRELRRYPNVVLIGPWESTRALILAAHAVTTLTGTAGWEAMLLRKPVILGGHVFFADAPGVARTDEIYGAYEGLMRAYRRPGREEIIQYLCEYFLTLRKGTAVYSAQAYRGAENFDFLAQSLLRQDRIWRNP